MKEKKIQELAKFFYSSNNSTDVPIRLAIISGQFSGFDFTKEGFIELFRILNNSKDLKKDLLAFRNKYE